MTESKQKLWPRAHMVFDLWVQGVSPGVCTCVAAHVLRFEHIQLLVSSQCSHRTKRREKKNRAKTACNFNMSSSLLPTAKTQGLTQNTLPHMVTLCPLHPTSPPPPPSSILQSPPSTLTTRRHLTSRPNPCVCVCVCVWRVADWLMPSFQSCHSWPNTMTLQPPFWSCTFFSFPHHMNIKNTCGQKVCVYVWMFMCTGKSNWQSSFEWQELNYFCTSILHTCHLWQTLGPA